MCLPTTLSLVLYVRAAGQHDVSLCAAMQAAAGPRRDVPFHACAHLGGYGRYKDTRDVLC